MKLRYTEVALEQLEQMPRIMRLRIREKLDFYVAQDDPFAFAKRLSGFPVYRFRVGGFRAIFKVKDQTIFVLMIVKRDEAYRDL